MSHTRIMNRIVRLPLYFFYMIKLWKRILYGDVSFYHCEPDGTSFLSAWTTFQIAWSVWMS